jgi:hypothetical protein
MNRQPFARRYWSRLTRDSIVREARAVGGAQTGYTFWQRYWALLTMADLPAIGQVAGAADLLGRGPQRGGKLSKQAPGLAVPTLDGGPTGRTASASDYKPPYPAESVISHRERHGVAGQAAAAILLPFSLVLRGLAFTVRAILGFSTNPFTGNISALPGMAITFFGILIDYLAGRLLWDSPAIGVFAWAASTSAAALAFDFTREARRQEYVYEFAMSHLQLHNRAVFRTLFRGADLFRWRNLVNAAVAAAFSALAAYAFTLGTLTIRFAAIPGGPALGRGSAYDEAAIAFITDFQTSSTMWWFILACFTLALLFRLPTALSLGVLGVTLTRATTVALPRLPAIRPGFQSQLERSLAVPNGWLLHLPADDVVLGCMAAFFIGLLSCAVTALVARD